MRHERGGGHNRNSGSSRPPQNTDDNEKRKRIDADECKYVAKQVTGLTNVTRRGTSKSMLQGPNWRRGEQEGTFKYNDFACNLEGLQSLLSTNQLEGSVEYIDYINNSYFITHNDEKFVYLYDGHVEVRTLHGGRSFWEKKVTHNKTSWKGLSREISTKIVKERETRAAYSP